LGAIRAAVGGQGISFNQGRGLTCNAYGYPAAGKFNGQTLRSCSGTATPDPYGQTQSQGIPCDMTGGSSGGPWLISSNTVLPLTPREMITPASSMHPDRGEYGAVRVHRPRSGWGGPLAGQAGL